VGIFNTKVVVLVHAFLMPSLLGAATTPTCL
jgi:hypothetical protein